MLKVMRSTLFLVGRCGHQEEVALHTTDVRVTTLACNYTAKPWHMHIRFILFRETDELKDCQKIIQAKSLYSSFYRCSENLAMV